MTDDEGCCLDKDTGRKESIFMRLLGLSAPIIGLNVLGVLALAVDTAMCGRLPDSEQALTALSFATQVIFLVMVAMIGLTVGTVALVARSFGADKHDRVNHILQQSTMFTMMLSVVVGLLGNLFAPQILAALGASPDVIDLGLDYLRPLLTGTLFNYLVILYGAILRGVGNTRLPFFIAIATNLANVGLNYGLILGNYGMPSLGVMGAALGTVCSQILGVILFIVLLQSGAVGKLRLKLRVESLDWTLAKELIKIGLPASMDMLILNASFLSIVGMLGRLEEVAVAAHGIGLRIQALAFVPGMSVSQATGAMVGQALGAGDVARAKKVVWASVVLCFTIMTALAVAIIVAVEPIVAIFDVKPDTKLFELSILWIKLLGYGMPIVGLYIAFVGMIQGAGQTQVSLKINVLGTLIFQIPLSALLGFTFEMGVFGVWVAFPLAFVIKSICAAYVYKQGRWARTGLKA